jgi:hypothetical protein
VCSSALNKLLNVAESALEIKSCNFRLSNEGKEGGRKKRILRIHTTLVEAWPPLYASYTPILSLGLSADTNMKNSVALRAVLLRGYTPGTSDVDVALAAADYASRN